MKAQPYDDSFIAKALPVFVSEAHEQIEALEQLLLRLEDAPDDRGLLDALFRCAHTVKGSAGIFGLDALVAFTHHVETLLDRLREGEVALTPALGSLLLHSNDQIRLLVSQAQDPLADNAETLATREAVVQRLKAACATTEPVAADPPGPGDELPRWHVSAHFGQDTFRNGMDPLALLTYVAGLGDMPRMVCDLQAVPPLDQIDPECCHLAFEFSLDTDASRQEIESAFGFVRDDCTLRLTEPGSTPKDFASLIAATPDHPRIGEILVSVGAVSRQQLNQALQSQADSLDHDGHAPPLGRVLQSRTGLNPQVVAAALHKQRQREGAGGPQASSAGDDNRFIRVQAARLDEVITLLGELVIAGAGASLLARQSRQRPLVEANQQITRLVEEIRNSTLQLRMVPIGETFARFRRVVRDTAAELGKDVALQIVGGDTELDKSVVERIADPLMHLVRNALDHGLETPAERTAQGKPAQGTLALTACHESGSILIKIRDDGRGIQRDKVLQRAWERGLVEPGVQPPDAEIDRLVFEAGFSTADKITNLSGRGVGMDVVRRNIEALRGSVTLSSEPGAGSCIEIRLPLTLAIIDGFLVGVGPSKFIFPLDAVVEVIESRPGTTAGTTHATANDARGRHCVELRGQVLPVVDLRALYELDSPVPEQSSIVVIRDGSGRYGVRVDALLGQHQTVIKPLNRLFRSLRGMSGSSILGTGEVALIFDVGSLGELAALGASAVKGPGGIDRQVPPPPMASSPQP